MNFNEEVLIHLAMWRNPRLTRTEATTFAREFRQKFLDVDDLMTSRDVEAMRRVVSSVDRLIRDLRSLMTDKEACHFFSAVYGGFGGLGLLASTPIGAGVFVAGILLCIGFGISAGVSANRIKDKIRQIQNTIEADCQKFRLVAAAIRRLDELCQRYMNTSLFSEENRQFLNAASNYGVTGKYCAAGKGDWLIKALNFFAIAESFAQFYAFISGCSALSTASAMVPFLAAGLQTLLLIKAIDENNDTMDKLSEGVAAMRKKCDVLEVLYN